MKLAIAGAGLVVALLAAPAAGHADDDIPQLVTSTAIAHGVNPGWMLRTAWCESRYNRYAVSPDGSNIGLFQLNRHGKLPVFFARGYDDPWDPAQQSNFAAEQFAAGQSGVWTCA